MTSEELNLLENIASLQEKLSHTQINHWQQYSHIGTWQFWFGACLLLLPLIILYFLIDRSKMMLLGFYGFNIHVWFGYSDIFGVRQGLWQYPHQLIPFFPFALSLDASLVPIVFMLVYQWTLNHNKNFYIYSIGVSLFFAFIFKPFLSSIHLFRFGDGANYLTLFFGYLGVFLFSKIITNVFLYMREKPANG
ncbi:CBO0543 family protein [Tuberibacillus sp. Marseille-P3662]|uniref:CBO0543 family protein n=1 Tax=Tuberibacillus sp. Marseille-P3662 TaxID=1965358 RepID=UPI000A1C9F7D|nr:CBO0543 family protein [Tuberibacillus sp. Marseille-P3662]